ncbi:MAG: hypothetical protein R2867_08540 [Caldilineaceae bacterium]
MLAQIRELEQGSGIDLSTDFDYDLPGLLQIAVPVPTIAVKEYTAALDDYAEAIRIEPDNDIFHNRGSSAYYRMAEYETIENFYRN